MDRMGRRISTLAVVLILLAGPVAAQFDQPPFPPGLQSSAGENQLLSPGSQYFHADAINSLATVRPGDGFHIAIRLKIDPGWVFYSPDPGVSDLFTPIGGSVAAEADDIEIAEPRWLGDHPHITEIGPGKTIVNNVYEDETVIYVPARVSPGAEIGEKSLSITINGLLCSDTGFQCLPLHETVTAAVQVADRSAANEAWTDALAAGMDEAMTLDQLRALHGAHPTVVAAAGAGEMPDVADWSIWTGLALALLAGLILNVMPCVLPVVPIRIMSIVDAARGRRRRFVTLGLAFAGGIMLFFLGLGVINIILQLATQEFFWGRHFQFGAFRIGLAMLMIALACNLFGVFNVLVPRKIAAVDTGVSARAGSHLGSMGMGLMMAVLATPCSFATLMAVLGWASIKPIWLGTLAILIVGVGMALPHALLATFPSLLKKLPKPGRWMELLKQAMGFAVLAVAAWLIGTLSETTYIMRVTGFGVLLAFGLWVWGVWVRYDAPLLRKLAIRGSAVVIVAASGFWLLPAPKPLAVKFEPFSEARIFEARQEGHTVLVKFSATWCASCPIIDHFIYNDPAVATELLDRDVVTMKGDVSDRGSPAEDLLYRRLGGAPPLTVVYPPGAGLPIRLPGKFSHDDLTAALDAASPR